MISSSRSRARVFFSSSQKWVIRAPEVCGVHLTRVRANAAGKVGKPEYAHAANVDFFIDCGALDVAAGFHGEVDDNAAGFHGLNHLFGDDDRRFAAEELCGGDNDIGLGADFRHGLALHGLLLFGKFFRIALFGLSGLAKVDLDEFRAERLDLFFPRPGAYRRPRRARRDASRSQWPGVPRRRHR